MIKIIAAVFLAEALAAAGQAFFKKASNSLSTPHLKDMKSYGTFLGEIFGRPEIWAGFLLIVVGMVAWLAALSQADLSVVYPFGSIYYILVLVVANLFLHEKMDRMKLIGTLLIMTGIAVISLSGHS